MKAALGPYEASTGFSQRSLKGYYGVLGFLVKSGEKSATQLQPGGGLLSSTQNFPVWLWGKKAWGLGFRFRVRGSGRIKAFCACCAPEYPI